MLFPPHSIPGMIQKGVSGLCIRSFALQKRTPVSKSFDSYTGWLCMYTWSCRRRSIEDNPPCNPHGVFFFLLNHVFLFFCFKRWRKHGTWVGVSKCVGWCLSLRPPLSAARGRYTNYANLSLYISAAHCCSQLFAFSSRIYLVTYFLLFSSRIYLHNYLFTYLFTLTTPSGILEFGTKHRTLTKVF